MVTARQLAALKRYAPDIQAACDAIGERPYLVAAVALRETGAGLGADYLPQGSPDGTGDHGHGRGLFQIDDRGPYAHLVKPAPWPVLDQATACAQALMDARAELRAWLRDPRYETAVVCCYNTSFAHVLLQMKTPGASPDTVTTGRNYGTAVLYLESQLRSLTALFSMVSRT